MNQVSRASFDVPVLPAIGMCSFSFAAAAVPSVVTDCSMFATTYATSGGIACVPVRTAVGLPSIASTKRGFAVMPPAANVAYAFVISSGVTSPAPRAIAIVSGSLLSMPIAFAVVAILPSIASPSSSAARWIETVLIDFAIAMRSRTWPSNVPVSKLRGFQLPYFSNTSGVSLTIVPGVAQMCGSSGSRNAVV